MPGRERRNITSNTKILVTALMTYIVVCLAGGAAYCYYTMMAPPPAEAETGELPPPKPREKTDEAARKAEETKAKAEAAAKAAEEAKKKAAEKQQARSRAARRDLDKVRLTAGMDKSQNGTVTLYNYPRAAQLPSGLYLNPSLAEGRNSCRLQYELYYYYNINDGQGTAWIFGDRAVIKAGGKHYEFAFDPQKRQKALAPDAEWLSERYTGVADEAWLAALRGVIAAGYGTITYYQQGGKSVTGEFSGEAYQHIKDMVELYDLNMEQGKEEADD